ncbi:hypothetical protein D3C81_685500 [compost metagenome]
MLGRPLAERAALVVRVFKEFGGVVGVAGDQLQAAEYLAADLGFDTLAAHSARGGGAVPVVTGEARGGIGDCAVFLVVAEQRQRGVDPAVEQFALEAGFVVAADHRLEWRVADGALGLRHEHVGVAGVPGPFRGQVINETDKWRDFAGLGHAAGGVGLTWVEAAIGGAGIAEVEPADPRPENQGQAVDRLDPPDAVQALLANIVATAFGTAEGGGEQAVTARLGAVVIDVEDAVVATEGAPVTIVAGQLGIVAAQGHFVGHGAGVEVADHVHVQPKLGGMEVGDPVGVLQASAVGLQAFADGLGALVGGGVGLVHAHGGGLEGPVVVETVLQVQVVSGDVGFRPVPVGAGVGRAGQVDGLAGGVARDAAQHRP